MLTLPPVVAIGWRPYIRLARQRHPVGRRQLLGAPVGDRPSGGGRRRLDQVRVLRDRRVMANSERLRARVLRDRGVMANSERLRAKHQTLSDPGIRPSVETRDP